ncbi:unnamed protein product [Gordionus sp. m RMFG-2023]|uniref:LIM/homeobox protein Lhx5-like n=1 Tax=Gordionus sp. m RMFG-2023 TaxID=3053472 RepID=UPI0030DEAB02
MDNDNLLDNNNNDDTILVNPEHSNVTTNLSKVPKSPPIHSALYQECAGCKKCIQDKYLLKAENKFWHEDCLKCSCCECRLGEVGSSFFLKANLFLCKRDYLRLFGNTGYCTACEKVIPAFEMVMKAKSNVYHLECFACQECNHRFCVGDKFYLWQNKILCEKDYRSVCLFQNFHQNPAFTNNTNQQSSPSSMNNYEENNSQLSLLSRKNSNNNNIFLHQNTKISHNLTSPNSNHVSNDGNFNELDDYTQQEINGNCDSYKTRSQQINSSLDNPAKHYLDRHSFDSTLSDFLPLHHRNGDNYYENLNLMHQMTGGANNEIENASI